MKKIIKEILIFLWLFFGVTSLLMIIPSAIFGENEFTGALVLICIFLVFKRFAKKRGYTESFFQHDKSLKDYWKLILLITSFDFLLVFLISEILIVITNFFPVVNNYIESNIVLQNNWGAIILSLITIGLITPFVEEYIFRGVLFRQLQPVGLFKAIVLVSLIFSLMHFNLVAGIETFIVSIVWCVIAWRFNDLRISMIAHGIFNTVSMLISYANNKSVDSAYEIILIINAVFMVIYLWKNRLKIKMVYEEMKNSDIHEIK